MIEIRSSIAGVKLPIEWEIEIRLFLQMQLNRLIVGNLRYGNPNRRTLFMTRLGKEFEAYKKYGNAEQLINIANYAILEFYKPENKKFHFDAAAESVTRGEMGTVE